MTGSDFSSDSNTLSIRLKNAGQAALPTAHFYLVDEEDKSFQSPRQVLQSIPVQAEALPLAFTLPDGISREQRDRLKLEVRPMRPPLYTQWLLPLEIKAMPAHLQALLALASLALLGFTIFYFRRYRHPLVLELSEQPQALLRLPFEQLPEAQQRLTQTRRLDKILSDAAVSPQTLQAAISFQQLAPTEKATTLAQRIGVSLPAPLVGEGLGMGGNAGGTNTFFLHLPPDFPLNVDKFLLFFPGELAAEDVFTHLKNIPEAQSRITLIMGNDSACQRKLYNTTRDPSNKWVAPQGGDITRLLLTPDAEIALAEILAGQLALQQISPYRVGGGVSNESVFFGRRELIAQIINRDPANYLMVGGRQVGKSTLLKAIERRYADNPQVQCHYLTLSSEVLVPRLAALLKLDKTDDPEMLAAQLDEHIRHTGQRYLFLIDEADRFIAAEKAHDYRILNVFRRLSEEGGCTFILAGFWQLYQHAVLDYQSPIRNFGELLSVGALEKPACHDLAVQPMQTMSLAYANTTLVGHLVESCGQRANLIAIACQHIVRNLPPQSRIIEAGDVDKALRSDELRRALAGWSIGETEREQAYERMIVYATIEHESFTTADLLQLAKQQGLNVDTQELDRTLSRLELAFIIGRDSGRWFYRVPLFVDYIREDAPAEKLAAELQRLLVSS